MTSSMFKKLFGIPVFFAVWAVFSFFVMTIPCLFFGFISMFSPMHMYALIGFIKAWWELWRPWYYWCIGFVVVRDLPD